VGSAPASRNSSGSASIDQSWIASGKLQPVFEDQLSLEVQGHFMVYPARHASRPEVKCFMDWLRGEAGR
jgi:DNA-binding transcriptional LysR family regulator